jgi:hypothetical protein
VPRACVRTPRPYHTCLAIAFKKKIFEKTCLSRGRQLDNLPPCGGGGAKHALVSALG